MNREPTHNPTPTGFGFAVRAGLEACRGDRIAIVMADGSDEPADLIRYYNKIDEGYVIQYTNLF